MGHSAPTPPTQINFAPPHLHLRTSTSAPPPPPPHLHLRTSTSAPPPPHLHLHLRTSTSTSTSAPPHLHLRTSTSAPHIKLIRVGGVGAECLHSAFKLQKKKLSREWAADSSVGRAEDCSRFRNCP